MLTDLEIKELIECPKKITDADPKNAMKIDIKSEFNERRNLEMISLCNKNEFTIILRRNTMLTEQFSIGLLYKPRIKGPPNFFLLRYNGSHGTTNFSKDGHYGNFHIHTTTRAHLDKGIYEPKKIELTSLYNTFDRGLTLFLNRINVTNIKDFFPSPDKQIDLFSQ